MGKVEHERKTTRFMWNGYVYPYSAQAGRELQVQQREPPADHNCLPKNGARAADGLLAALSERLRDGSIMRARSLSSSSCSSNSSSSRMISQSSASTPETLSAAELSTEAPFKRLAFVRSQGTLWLEWMSSAYSQGRSYIPLPYRVVSAVEKTLNSYSGGLCDLATRRSDEALHALDDRVDLVLRSTSDKSGWLRDLAQHRPVRCAVTAYQSVHDSVVANPAYTRAVQLGEGTLTRVHESSLFKSLQPLVGPLAEPTVKRILDSPAFQAVKAHLMPTT